MQTRRLANGGVFVGMLLILLGVIFSLAATGTFGLHWSNFWPAVLMAAGVALLTQSIFLGQDARPWTVLLGTMLLLLGVFFFATTLGYAEWDEQVNLWPLYLIIVGGSFLAAYASAMMQRLGFLVAGLILAAVGGICEWLVLAGVVRDGRIALLGWTVDFRTVDWQTFGESTLGRSSWPVLLVLLGAALMLVGFFTKGLTGRAALISLGTIPLLLGIFFLVTTLGLLRWEDQGILWPTYPLVAGIALLIWYVLLGSQPKALLWAGVGLVALAAVFYGETFMGYSMWAQLWPLALIVVGAFLLLPRMNRKAR